MKHMYMFVYSDGAAPPDCLETAQGHWQAAGNSGMHHYIRMQLSAVVESQFSRQRSGATTQHTSLAVDTR